MGRLLLPSSIAAVTYGQLALLLPARGYVATLRLRWQQVGVRPTTALGDEVEFAFDTDPGEIRRGTTATPATTADDLVAGPATAGRQER